MKKYIIILLVFTLTITFNSCNEDFLEIPQQGSVQPDGFYINASDDDADALIAYIYKYVYSNTGPGWVSFWSAMANDRPATGDAYSNTSISASNHPANSYYSFFYRLNLLCNKIIDLMNEDTDEKAIVKGEAYFWRAWAYTYLIQGWGNPPLVDHELAIGELPGNTEKDALWDYVFTSLNEAIDRLPAKSTQEGQNLIGGRVTKHSAYSLLGKAQLWSGNYGNAIISLGTVISSDLYDLISDYSDLYHPQADFCKEYIWEWNINDANAANYTSETDNRTVTMGWRSENVAMPGSYTGNGFGNASTYTKDFYDFMIDRGEKGLNRYMGTIWDYEDVLDKFIELEGAANRTEALGIFWKESPILADCQGYMRAKMYVLEDEVFPYLTDKDIYSFANWPGMRYSEVLLNYAEACAQNGTDLDEGLAALNKVRDRAGLDLLGTLTLQSVKDEKRAELVLEGDRFLDLIRWGDAATELENRGFYNFSFKGYVEGTDPEAGTPADYDIATQPIQNAANFVVGRDEVFPYPYTEVLLNSNLDQNSNWE